NHFSTNKYSSIELKTMTEPKCRTTLEEALFLRQNDYWIICYRGQAAFLESTRGLCCLAVLLGYPGPEFHVSELLACLMTESGQITANRRETTRLDGGMPKLDAQTKAECKRRLNDLRQDLNEAERFNDAQRRTKAQNELQAVADYFASAVGLGGR